MELREYIKEDGSNPYKAWFNSLNPVAAAKISVAMARMTLGNTSNIRWFSGIGEYKIDWGPGYRIYLAKDGDNLIILYGGGTKKRQQKDINTSIKLHEEYKIRKKRLNKGQLT